MDGMELKEVRAANTELELAIADELYDTPDKTELNNGRIPETEVAGVVEFMRAGEDPSPTIGEVKLNEVSTPEASPVDRTEVTKVELMYGAPIEVGAYGVLLHVSLEVLLAEPDMPPQVIVTPLMAAVVISLLADEVADPGSGVLKTLKPDWAAREDFEIAV